jgi:hypothetical protein
VRADSFDLLVEAKNQKRKVDVSDIDDLRARLGRVSSDIVGAIFTTSGLTKAAIEAIESDRTREILAFVQEEINDLHAGYQNLKTLIDRKRSALRVHGKIWFGSKRHLEFADVPLPRGGVEFRIDNVVQSYFESKSGFSGPSYSLRIPDSGWGSFGGEGARISIKLSLNSLRDLRDIFGYLHKKFGLSRNGMFSIKQSECCWYGSGAEEFLDALENWGDRYKKSLSKKYHHSEEFMYLDQFRSGWLEVSAQQTIDWDLAANEESQIHNSELVIQLPGIPVDTFPFVKLCQYTENEWADFGYIGQRWTSTCRLKKPLPLRVIGTVRNKEQRLGASQRSVVVGIIAKNPFNGRKTLPAEMEQSEVPFCELQETDLLLCSLRDWHDDVDVADRYRLQGFEITVGGIGGIIRPFGTWDNLIKNSD